MRSSCSAPLLVARAHRLRDLRTRRRPSLRGAAHVARLTTRPSLSVRPVDDRRHARAALGAGAGAIAGGVAAANAGSYQRRGHRARPARRGRRRRRRQRRSSAARPSRTASSSSSRCATASDARSSSANGNDGWAPAIRIVIVTAAAARASTRAPQVAAAGAELYPAPASYPAPTLPGAGRLSERDRCSRSISRRPGAPRSCSASPASRRSARRILRPRRPAGLDVALVDLELDADVALRRVPAPHRPGVTPSLCAEVGIVAAQPQRRVGAPAAHSSQAARECHLARPTRVVEHADVGGAHVAVQLGREAVRRDVDDAVAGVADRRGASRRRRGADAGGSRRSSRSRAARAASDGASPPNAGRGCRPSGSGRRAGASSRRSRAARRSARAISRASSSAPGSQPRCVGSSARGPTKSVRVSLRHDACRRARR